MNSKYAHVGLAFATALLWSSCYFFNDFDNLGVGPTGPGGGVDNNGGSGQGADGGSSDGGGAMGGGGNATGGNSGGAGGIGGAGGSAPCPPPNQDYTILKISEIAPSGVPQDWIEIVNIGAESVNLCAVFIGEEYNDITPPSGGDRYTWGNVVIGAGDYLVIERNIDFTWGISKDTPERTTLFAPDSSVLDDTTYTLPTFPPFEYTAGETWARIPDMTGAFQVVTTPTKGDSNQNGGVGGAGGTGGSGGTGG